jgi:hypothetical protein
MFDEIIKRMEDLAMQTRGRQYDGHHEAVIALLSDAKKALTMPDGQIRPWERAELDQAALAVRINFLKVALNCIGKAIEVSQLTPDYYASGFNYIKTPAN